MPSAAEVVIEPSPRSAVEFELVRESGPGTPGERWVLPRTDVRIGRSSACFVSVSDGKVSRAHALLAVGADAVEVRDLDSGNGTFVNEAKTGEASVPLQVGDRLRVGDTSFELRIADR
jgi:pSer/pThr/pTyr-binding forkhead associated (FHA) protein